jgi:hypothetical protein
MKMKLDKIPKFECINGCNACCGPVPINEEEARRLNLSCSGITQTVSQHNLTCTYSKNGKCTVYQNRPFICRIFGVTKSLKCPNNGKPERILSSREERKLLEEYMDLPSQFQEKTYEYP